MLHLARRRAGCEHMHVRLFVRSSTHALTRTRAEAHAAAAAAREAKHIKQSVSFS